MSATLLSDVTNQVQKFWSPLFMDELIDKGALPALVSKEYEGEIKKGGDTVYVSQLNTPTADTKTIGTDAESFSSQKMSTSRISIQANKRITASFEVEDVLDIQSQLDQANPKLRQALVDSVLIALNNYLYTIVSPSTSAPDHSIASVSDMNKSQLVALRILAGQAKWKKDGWYGLLDASYYGDVLADTTLTSSDYDGGDLPMVAGQVVKPRMGFNLIEDNSDGILTLSPASAGADVGLFFHPDFMHLVMQKQPTFKISDLHSNKQHGYLISVDLIVGAALGVDGANKHIVVYNS